MSLHENTQAGCWDNAHAANCVCFHKTTSFSSHYTNLMGNLPPGPVPHHLWRTAWCLDQVLAGHWIVRCNDSIPPPSCVEWTLLLTPDLHCTCCPGLQREGPQGPWATGKPEPGLCKKRCSRIKIHLQNEKKSDWPFSNILGSRKSSCSDVWDPLEKEGDLYLRMTDSTTNIKYFQQQKPMY